MNAVTIPDAVFEYSHMYQPRVSYNQALAAWRNWYTQQGFAKDSETNLLSRDGVLYAIDINSRKLVARGR
jgi:hypothetical protein